MTYQLIEYDEIDSTNNEAKRLVLSGDATQSIIFAYKQTSGRGRYGRVWESKPGNLYMSILMPLELPLSRASELSFVMGLAVIDALSPIVTPEFVKQISGAHVNKSRGAAVNLALKWPNDIFIDDSKIGGILLESVTHNSQTWLIIGVGLNIMHSPTDIPNTSSLKECLCAIMKTVIPEFAKQISGTQVNTYIEATQRQNTRSQRSDRARYDESRDCEELSNIRHCEELLRRSNPENIVKSHEATSHTLNLIMKSFNKYHYMWQTYGFSNIRALWLKHAYRLGMEVTIGDVENRISGIFESINESGAIILKLASGEIYTLSTGEMFF